MSRHLLSQLGLDRHADERAVKRAYAARLKSRRPDDDPVLFQQLHEVYQGALEYVRRRAEAQPIFSGTGLPSPPVTAGALSLEAAEAGTDRREPPLQGPAPRERMEVPEPPFNAGAFFDELLEVGRGPPGQLHAWLHQHPDLYSIQLRHGLVPSLVHALETAEKLPTPDGLRLLLEFFGLDRIDRKNMHLFPRLELLHDIAHRQHQVLVGPDMSFMYAQNGAPKPRPAAGPTPLPVIPIIFLMIFLANLARCVGSNDVPAIPVDRYPPPEQSTGAWPETAPNPKPWQYAPPIPSQPPPAEQDPD